MFGSLHLSAVTICCIVWKVLRPWASTSLELSDDNIHRWNDCYFTPTSLQLNPRSQLPPSAHSLVFHLVRQQQRIRESDTCILQF